MLKKCTRRNARSCWHEQGNRIQEIEDPGGSWKGDETAGRAGGENKNGSVQQEAVTREGERKSSEEAATEVEGIGQKGSETKERERERGPRSETEEWERQKEARVIGRRGRERACPRKVSTCLVYESRRRSTASQLPQMFPVDQKR